MEFCERCGGMILVKEGKAQCMSCGYRPRKAPVIKTSEKINQAETIAVIKEESDNTYPIVDIKCPKCKNPKAYFWTQQTRGSDESETKFYKCTKCKHTWRVYK
jgi:DNA-directed RNA polymerase subunit M